MVAADVGESKVVLGERLTASKKGAVGGGNIVGWFDSFGASIAVVIDFVFVFNGDVVDVRDCFEGDPYLGLGFLDLLDPAVTISPRSARHFSADSSYSVDILVLITDVFRDFVFRFCCVMFVFDDERT